MFPPAGTGHGRRALRRIKVPIKFRAHVDLNVRINRAARPRVVRFTNIELS